MEISLIYGGKATLEELVELNEKKGMEFVVEGGKISEIIHPA